jgi:hypothetical protein
MTTDTFDLETASKDEMEAYAIEHFGVDLNKRKSAAALRDEVSELQAKAEVGTVAPADKTPAETATVNEKDDRKYLLNASTGVVFPATKALEKRGDLVPCDKDGKLI